MLLLNANVNGETVRNLPQRILCHQCGAILYEGIELKPPDEIIQKYNGKCPKCGRKLSVIPANVEVKSAK